MQSRYRRDPSDLPSLGRRIGVALRVRRFYCRHPRCTRRTFAERLPELVLSHARRTCRLATAKGQVGVALGGAAGSRLLRHLAMPTSADTVLRLVRRMPLPEPASRSPLWRACSRASLASVLGVSKAGYHARVRRPPSAHAVADEALLKRVRTVHAGSRQAYGAPRVHADLQGQAERHDRKRIARLMRLTRLPDLLRQPERDITSLTADGAYEGKPVYQAAAARQPSQPPDVVIPPRASAVLSTADPDQQSSRDRHIQFIAAYGRMA